MMTLKEGKFYKDGERYPIEFGNKDQLQLLDKVQALMHDGCLLRGNTDEDLDGEIEEVEYKYICVCGHITKKKYSYEENLELEIDKFKCACNLSYKIEPCDFSEFFVVIKLVTPK